MIEMFMIYNTFSNSYNSNDTAELNDILSRLLRKYYLEIENNNTVDKIKDKYLNYCYKILGGIYGIPNEKFDFEYVDNNGNYHLDKNIEIYSYKDDKYKYNKVYYLEEGSLISGVNSSKVLNLNYKRVEELIIDQLNNNEPVYFSTSTTSKFEDGQWIDLMSRYSNLFDIDLNMDNNEIIKTYGSMGEHSMIITGVNTNKNNKKWKVENSWGSSIGNKGYFVMEDKFLKNNLISVVINKKYLNLKELDLLDILPIEVSKWDYKFN